MLKLLRIDVEKQHFLFEELSPEYARLGGRALSSSIINREVPPDVDALDPKNKLIFAAGILAGTGFANSSRLSVGSKSPLTGGIKEANAGGNAASNLAKLGIQAVVLEGRATGLTTLKIDADGVSFVDAGPIKGLGNYQVIEDLKKAHGDKVSIVSIGPAGERQLKAASVSVTSPDFYPRMAARGGLGAVMGSKNVKALVIDSKGAKGVEIKDKPLFKAAASKFTKGVLAYPMIEGLNALGTPILVNMINGMGCLPTRNYSVGQFDKAHQISGEHMAELMSKRPNSVPGHKCMTGCVIGCSNVFTDEKGEVIVSGLEYETIVLTGSNCMIDDIDMIAKINWACNDIGVDTMDVGAAIALAMEADILKMGDATGALALVSEIREGTDNGLLIGNGCKVTGERLGSKRIPHVKGQSLAAYDPRGLKGTGTSYATSAMGADHTVGNAIPNPLSQYDPASPKGQAEMSSFLQIYHAAIDSLGICLFASLPALDFADLQGHIVQGVAALYGETLDRDYIKQLGIATLKAEREFNTNAGFTKEDDRLPQFFKDEPLLPSGNVFDVSDEDLDRVNAF
ncbi:aldehyde ferredoxin oxidoreductase C-terminal domain-containing protein [Desulfobacula sp.]|uniref:aldehyde ferredoxin oxidoreductase family protein n=1 Tax=Desulfobacula sp. TaxID=2593537 RepID=UPI0026318797|nr:aldehyde ferredoxin oxidoreductase C-terminal domain-containing protein [Desulfobacula sp.]